MKKSKLVQLYKLKSINIENKKQQELRKMYNFYERKLAEEKSRFDSLLRDKIKQGKQLKRARKGIDYWKNKCALVSIDRDIVASDVANLKAHNKSLLIELNQTRKALYSQEGYYYKNMFDIYNLHYKNDDLMASDDNDNTIIVGKKHG